MLACYQVVQVQLRLSTQNVLYHKCYYNYYLTKKYQKSGKRQSLHDSSPWDQNRSVFSSFSETKEVKHNTRGQRSNSRLGSELIAGRSENLGDHTSKQKAKGEKGQVRESGTSKERGVWSGREMKCDRVCVCVALWKQCMFFCLSCGSMSGQREGRKQDCRWDGTRLEGQVWNLVGVGGRSRLRFRFLLLSVDHRNSFQCVGVLCV